jgi:quercetin dioxygenase-like cupin family protein
MRAIGAVLAVAVAVFGLGAAWAVEGDLPGRTELKRADLDGAPGMEVITSIVVIAPGEVMPAHVHHGVETGYVLEGGRVAPEGKAEFELATGAPLMNPRGVVHGGFKVVSDTPIKLLTVHIVDKDKPLYDGMKP